ncbi:MAG: hypothetical protein AAGA25_10050 [Planctomycetota bacterium]
MILLGDLNGRDTDIHECGRYNRHLASVIFQTTLIHEPGGHEPLSNGWLRGNASPRHF